ncbi:MAG: hypothetical protein MRZ79_05725 [Bacteroidia bacterium]|nr:hypothetical protein [Bacteroidia bacterium]
MILLWIIGIVVAINITFRLFGNQILNFGLKQMVKRLAKHSEEQSQAYAKFYADESNRENVFVDRDVKVSAPKSQENKKISEDDIAEDIEFEELK